MKIYLLLICITLNSCMTGKIAVKTGIEEIHFGNGGGFTGEVKAYTLIADNKLFEEEKEVKKIDTKKTLALFNEAKELKDYNFHEPENMYSFIEIRSKEKINRIVWALGSTSIDKRVIELHSKLISITK